MDYPITGIHKNIIYNYQDAFKAYENMNFVYLLLLETEPFKF